MKSKQLVVAVASAAQFAIASTVVAQQDDKGLTIEKLLTSGWQVAGFSDASDNRSAFILFKHPSETHLVQCRTGFDVTRSPPVYANCYKLR